MMKLTGTDGVELVNPSRIVTVRGWDEDDGNHAMVVCTNRVTVVRETPEEVAEEFRAAMADELSLDEFVARIHHSRKVIAAAKREGCSV